MMGERGIHNWSLVITERHQKLHDLYLDIRLESRIPAARPTKCFIEFITEMPGTGLVLSLCTDRSIGVNITTGRSHAVSGIRGLERIVSSSFTYIHSLYIAN